MHTVKLSNGVAMPCQGFGVFQIPDHDECRQAVASALEAGCRLIDTASVYSNERAVGEAIAQSGIARADVFVTTKAWVTEMGQEATLKAFNASIDRLGLDYIDLYLVHMPLGDYYGAWRAMEQFYAQGRVRAIGVCNFEADRLLDLCHSAKVLPMVDQVETHPFTQQRSLLELARRLGVQLEAWAPFAEGRNSLFTNARLQAIGARYGKTAAQVVLRWHLQRGVVAIPKSVHRQRIIENLDITDFTLTEADMQAIASMDTGGSLILDVRSTAEVDRLYGIEVIN